MSRKTHFHGLAKPYCVTVGHIAHEVEKEGLEVPARLGGKLPKYTKLTFSNANDNQIKVIKRTCSSSAFCFAYLS